MAEIKVKPKGTIKKLEKEVVQVQKFKNNLITAKEKVYNNGLLSSTSLLIPSNIKGKNTIPSSHIIFQ